MAGVKLLFVIASLLTAIIAQSPRSPRVNVPLPIFVNPVFINGTTSSRGTCPPDAVRESARENSSRIVEYALIDVFPDCGNGSWTQVINFDMRNPSQQCPSNWVESATPARSCFTQFAGCLGSTFSVLGRRYNRVCGRAIGYAVNTPDGFINGNRGIDGDYVDGVSLTHGSPRQHIWTFSAGHGPQFSLYRCPCDNPNRGEAPLPPDFVGDNYFCDGDYNGALWDGRDCTTDCCTFNSPPWFSVTLPAPTSHDIEVRICSDSPGPDENLHLSLLQIFVQ